MSGKTGYLLKCQGNVRKFYNFQFVSNDKKQKMARAIFLIFLNKLNHLNSFYNPLNIRIWKYFVPHASSAAFLAHLSQSLKLGT